MPLDKAFWTYAVAGGLAVNLATSFVFLALVSADRPLAALVAGYGLSLPYNLLAAVGVWRAAERHDGDPARAALLRSITAIGLLLLSLT